MTQIDEHRLTYFGRPALVHQIDVLVPPDTQKPQTCQAKTYISKHVQFMITARSNVCTLDDKRGSKWNQLCPHSDYGQFMVSLRSVYIYLVSSIWILTRSLVCKERISTCFTFYDSLLPPSGEHRFLFSNAFIFTFPINYKPEIFFKNSRIIYLN